ncbi:hypothetical protein [Halobacteriovorax sp. HLS]|uniref:hypothetical protein n=1 Tax=Halobacteriovorax sp. HLS TaxID=2234000 RepID=UPI000FD89C18|nr:hypothetical protein [Halobacteriovorax sp. HLS]
MNKLLIPILILLSSKTLSWETDNFTSRRLIEKVSEKEKLDNLFSLNDKMNKDIRKTLEAFSKDYNCLEDQEKLKNKKVPLIYSWIDDALGGTHAVIEQFAEEGGVMLYDHNREWFSMEANLMGKNYGLQGAFNLDGHVIGPDKVGHFVDQGFDLITEFIENGSDKDAFKIAMEESNDMEEGGFGLMISGVKSYGDMGANFSGLKFYHNLLSGENPQLTCDPKTKKYKLNYDFNWSDYVNDSWDEGLNCSFFESVDNPYKRKKLKDSKGREIATSDIEKIYPPADNDEKNFRKKLADFKPPMSCPASKDKCSALADINCSNYFISPKCIRQVDKKVSCEIDTFDKLFSVERKKNYSFARGEEEKRSEKRRDYAN